MQKKNIKDFDNFLNLSLYSIIAQFDIAILLETIRISKRKYEKALFARMLALTIIEYMDDINPLIGHVLRKDLDKNNLSEFITIFKNINKQYSTIKKDNNRLLREIRNTTAAHKSKDSFQLLNYIEEIDILKVVNLGIEITNITVKLTNETTKLTYKVKEVLSAKYLPATSGKTKNSL